MEVPIYRLLYDQKYRDKFQSYCQQIFDKAFLTNDQFVQQFEEQFAKWTDSPHALAVNNGTSAIEALLRSIDVKGYEVILPTNTFIATAVAVKNAGGIPVLADIEPTYASLDPNSAERLISKKTKAIITVHIGGLISPSILDLKELCNKNNLSLIEDCAHAHGCHFDGVHSGLFGIGGAFSFFTTKVLTTGEGGMVITSSPEIHKKLVSIRQFGKEETNPISHILEGNNFKLTEFQAALGLLEIERANERIQQRQKIAAHYQQRLKDSLWNPIRHHSKSSCSYYKQILWPKKENRENIKNYLLKNSVQITGGVYNIPLHRQPVFKNQYEDKNFPNANHFSEHHICPPCYSDLTMDEAETVCQLLLEYAH